MPVLVVLYPPDLNSPIHAWMVEQHSTRSNKLVVYVSQETPFSEFEQALIAGSPVWSVPLDILGPITQSLRLEEQNIIVLSDTNLNIETLLSDTYSPLGDIPEDISDSDFCSDSTSGSDTDSDTDSELSRCSREDSEVALMMQSESFDKHLTDSEGMACFSFTCVNEFRPFDHEYGSDEDLDSIIPDSDSDVESLPPTLHNNIQSTTLLDPVPQPFQVSPLLSIKSTSKRIYDASKKQASPHISSTKRRLPLSPLNMELQSKDVILQRSKRRKVDTEASVGEHVKWC